MQDQVGWRSRSEPISFTNPTCWASSRNGLDAHSGKEQTVADVTRLAIENVEEIFLQGFAASPRFA